MTLFLLDTNVPSELTKPRPSPEVFAWMKSVPQADLYVSAISIAELVPGIERHPDPIRQAHLRHWYEMELRRWFSTEVLPLSESTAERLGLLQAQQESIGRPMSFPDAAIAPTALEFGLTLVSRNTRHFTGLGVTLLNPWQPDSQGGS